MKIAAFPLANLLRIFVFQSNFLRYLNSCFKHLAFFLGILATKHVAHNKALKRDCKRLAVLV